MKKSVVWMLLAVLSVYGTTSFAQWRSAAQAAKNAAKRKSYTVPRIETKIRRAAAKNNSVVLRTPAFPAKANEVNASYLYQHYNISQMYQRSHTEKTPQEIQDYMTFRWIGPKQVPGIGQAFYEDQSALARDLNTYYDGSGIAVNVGGRLAKLYALPVDGILYKPAGYSEAVVLSSADHFVVYYPKTKTGQLAENTPQMRKFLSKYLGNSGSFDEVIKLGDKCFEMPTGEPDWKILEGPQELKTPAPAQKPAVEEVEGNFIDMDNPPAGFVGAMLRADHKMYMDQARQAKKFDAYWNRKFGVTHYTSQNQLARDMAAFYEDFPGAPQVYNRFSRQNFYVFELPVEGLEYAPEGSPKVHVLDPKTEVVLYHEKLGGQIVERATLDNKMFFEDVDDLEGIK